MTDEETHWVLVPCSLQELYGNPNLPLVKAPEAVERLEKIGRIVDGPRFWQNLEGSRIMANGRWLNGPGLIYFARLEVSSVPTTASDPAEGSSEVGSD